jgi:hypothetical protein
MRCGSGKCDIADCGYIILQRKKKPENEVRLGGGENENERYFISRPVRKNLFLFGFFSVSLFHHLACVSFGDRRQWLI